MVDTIDKKIISLIQGDLPLHPRPFALLAAKIGIGEDDFVAGVQPRGPRWMLDNGLEWLYRLCSDPRRLWRRYLIGNPLFTLRVLKQRIDKGLEVL